MKTLARGALLGVCALALSGVGTAALAQRGAWRGEDARLPRGERIAEYLELSERQVGEIKELREDGRSQMADLRKEMMRVKNEIRGEMLEDNPDMDTLKKLTAKKGEIRTEMEIARLEHRLAMREILTEEQRDKLMMSRSRGGRGRFDGRHGRGIGRGRMGRGRGAERGGPFMGMEQGDPWEDCLGLGPGPYLWCEK
jgi:Spy/CpxP family protein refolding chaperone